MALSGFPRSNNSFALFFPALRRKKQCKTPDGLFVVERSGSARSERSEGRRSGVSGAGRSGGAGDRRRHGRRAAEEGRNSQPPFPEGKACVPFPFSIIIRVC